MVGLVHCTTHSCNLLHLSEAVSSFITSVMEEEPCDCVAESGPWRCSAGYCFSAGLQTCLWWSCSCVCGRWVSWSPHIYVLSLFSLCPLEFSWVLWPNTWCLSIPDCVDHFLINKIWCPAPRRETCWGKHNLLSCHTIGVLEREFLTCTISSLKPFFPYSSGPSAKSVLCLGNQAKSFISC